jgi:hypothetical protein
MRFLAPMPALTPAWREALDRLRVEQPILVPKSDPRALHAIAIEGSMSSASAIVAGFPGTWELDRYEEEELVDATGEGIDLEWTSEVWVCAQEHAIFACIDHWQAGLFGTLTLFADRASFLDRLSELRAAA